MLIQPTQSNFTCQLKKFDPPTLAEGLSPQVVCDVIAALDLKFRLRIFTPFTTLFAFLSQVFNDDPSCRRAVVEVSARRLCQQKKPCSLGTSSLCKAKARLPIAFFEAIATRLGSYIESRREVDWAWRHGDVKVVDGTGLSMPDTPENRKRFHRPHGASFPVVRLLGIFSLATGGFIAGSLAAWRGKGVGELSLLHGLWQYFNPGDTLLGDSLFSNFWIWVAASDRGVKVVSEFSKKSWGRINGKRHDQIIEIKKPTKKPKSMSRREYNQAPAYIQVRIIKLCCAPKGFRATTKFIVTTHLDLAVVLADEILQLYKRRWQVELNLRSLKTILGMDVLRGQSPDMVQKEVWTYLIAYNLIRMKMVEVGKAYKKIPTSLSFRATQQILTVLRQIAGLGLNGAAAEAQLLAMLSTQVVGQRPDRYEPRAIKRRKKNFALFKGTRAAARRKQHKKYKTSKKTAA